MMIKRPGALATYNQVANMETNPLQQIVMLYDGAIKFLRLAAADIEAQDLAAKADHTARALDIVQYLQSILDFERGQDVAPVLDTLYSSVTALILKSSRTLDAVLMRHAADLLVPVGEAWAINAKAGLGLTATPANLGGISSASASLNRQA
jgi:flagellar secretion chaperone FliS